MNWYQSENGQFSIKIVFVNFEEQETFLKKIMTILIWRESLGKCGIKRNVSAFYHNLTIQKCLNS